MTRGTAIGSGEGDQAPRVVVAPDSFKGSMPAADVADRLAAGLARSGDVLADPLPVADGGEGTVAAALAAGFEAVDLRASGPLGEPRPVRYAAREGTAVVEMAAICGLEMIEPTPGSALGATSRGVGEVVRHALDGGAHTVVLAVGGSASTDGGAGMLHALGLRAPDGADVLTGGGGELVRLTELDAAGLDPRLATTTVILASDVDNPLLGASGAAQVYGAQKGADAAGQEALERGLSRWVQALADAGFPRARDHADAPGAGAAGGVGYAALAVLGAHRRPGIDMVLELTGFDARVAGAALVVTGEGNLDRQSLHGKAPVGVARAAARHGVPVVGVCGRTELTAPELREAGLLTAYALTTFEPDVQRCIDEPAPLLEQVGEQIARDLPLLLTG